MQLGHSPIPSCEHSPERVRALAQRYGISEALMGSKPSSWLSASTPCCRWTTDFTPRSPMQLFLNAYHYARRLKSLHGLTPYEYICKTWTELPYRFITDPTHHTPGTTHLICATSSSAESFPPRRFKRTLAPASARAAAAPIPEFAPVTSAQLSRNR